MCALVNVVSTSERRDWQRYLTVVTDGLRAGTATPMRS